jgi:hypothetical protein
MLITCGNLLQARVLRQKNSFLVFGSVTKVSIFVLSLKKFISQQKTKDYEQSRIN